MAKWYYSVCVDHILLIHHQLMNMCVVSSLRLLQIMLLRPFMYKCLCGHMFLFVLGICVPWCAVAGSNGSSVSILLRNCRTIFLSGYMLHSQPSFSTFLPALVIICLFDNSYSGGSQGVSPYMFISLKKQNKPKHSIGCVRSSLLVTLSLSTSLISSPSCFSS